MQLLDKYRTQVYTKLYTTVHNYTQQYTPVHSNKTVHNSTQKYTAVHSNTQLYKTVHKTVNCSGSHAPSTCWAPPSSPASLVRAPLSRGHCYVELLHRRNRTLPPAQAPAPSRPKTSDNTVRQSYSSNAWLADLHQLPVPPLVNRLLLFIVQFEVLLVPALVFDDLSLASCWQVRNQVANEARFSLKAVRNYFSYNRIL